MTLSKLVVLLALIASQITAAEAQNSESVYQFDSSWLDQNNQQLELSKLRGNKQLVAFVYTYCEHTCPLIIAQIKSILSALPGEPEELVRVTLFTLDPERDTPKQAKLYMQTHGLNEPLWTILSGQPDDVRILSNLFGVKYKAMQKGEIAHSNMITLLNADGVIVHQLKGLNANKDELINLIKN